MKTLLKLFTLILLVHGTAVFSQNIEGIRAIELRYGRTGTTGDKFKLLHERYLSQNLNLTVGVGAEFSRKNLINYKCFQIEALAEYYTGIGARTNDEFQVKAGVGVTANYHSEPDLFKEYSTLQKINYGIVFQATGEWSFTSDFSLTASMSQRLYKKKALGMFEYEYCLGIKWKFF
jgi:hypothetical protein